MKNIDLVYILGTGSRWHDNEIRYSIRSVEKYLPEHGKIFVVGEYPEWMSGAIHIEAKDSETNKLLNARNKYIAAASDPRVSKDFVLMNDDFFMTDEITEWKTYSRGKLKDMIKKHPTQNGYYFRSLQDTQKRLDGMGISDPIDYEVHCPMIFNKEKLLSVIGMIGKDKAYSIRTCYGNLMNIEAKKVIDFKAGTIAEFAYQTVRSNKYLSINDGLVADENFRNWVERKYPKMSIYEIDGSKGAKVMPGRSMKAIKYYAKKRFSYGMRTYQKGEIISPDDIQQLKKTKRLKDVWELK